jgi:hypothetical protein
MTYLPGVELRRTGFGKAISSSDHVAEFKGVGGICGEESKNAGRRARAVAPLSRCVSKVNTLTMNKFTVVSDDIWHQTQALVVVSGRRVKRLLLILV